MFLRSTSVLEYNLLCQEGKLADYSLFMLNNLLNMGIADSLRLTTTPPV